jgi:hypothetical protein
VKFGGNDFVIDPDGGGSARGGLIMMWEGMHGLRLPGEAAGFAIARARGWRVVFEEID